MAMAEPIRTSMLQRPMTTDSHILTLTQWLSPAFPVGAFAYSHGFETAIQSGAIATPGDLQAWLSDVLLYGSGRNDCILLRAAHACDTRAAVLETNETALALAACQERRLETMHQGSAFCKTTAAIWGGDALELVYPVAVGAAAAHLKIPVTLTCAMYCQAIAGNLVSAAVRAVPLGQTGGQAVLAALTPLCAEIAKDCQTATLDDLQSSAFLSDIAAMKHETLQPRIFRT